ncbi:MAG: redox-regulated ATPase YchF [Calditrichales bacterium]|nr:MAG: redox-regulated ATPase YchF [Calditrichales bacterium]
MQIGIVGLPFSGKSTLFETLLAHKNRESSGKFKSEAEHGVVQVPDQRLDQLGDLFKPPKMVYANVEYIKVPGIDQEGHRGSGLPGQFLANMKNVELVLVMIRSFENEVYPHPMGKIDPQRDINFINSEFLLNDLSIIENRIEKLEKILMKTQQDRDKKEKAVLKKCQAMLEEERPIRELDLDPQEVLLIKGFQFLTAKSILFVINVGEGDIGKSDELVEKYRPLIGAGCDLTALSAEIEKEIAELDKEDAEIFLGDLNIKEPATKKLIRISYDLLGLISFFTAGETECHAWTIRKNTIAQKAAGTIHSDMEKGFIRAEVVGYDTLLKEGGFAGCKDKGLLRLEGKEYIVKDGDVLTIRFNV